MALKYPPAIAEALSDRAITQRCVRVELEIGSAHGELLCDMAEWHPHCLYIGVDIDVNFCKQASELIRRRHLDNVIVVNEEALHFLVTNIPDGFLDALHVYHPTPRREGNFRRLITGNFEAETFRTLRPWGSLRLLTDDKEYYDSSMRLFSCERWWAVEWRRGEFALRRGAFAGSPLEMKFRAEGATLYPIQLTKVPPL